MNESVVVIGHPTDVQQYFLSLDQRKSNADQETRQITYFAPANDASLVTTYTNDTERVGSALLAMLKFSGATPSGTSASIVRLGQRKILMSQRKILMK